MIHAFDNGCKNSNANCSTASNPGSELWAFVPPSIIQNFKHIVTPQKYTKLEADVGTGDTSIKINSSDNFSSSGIVRINKAIAEASIKFNINEDELREKINDESFVLTERKKNG